MARMDSGVRAGTDTEPPAETSDANQRASEAAQQQSSSAFKWIGIAVLVLVVIGAIVFLMRRRTASERE